MPSGTLVLGSFLVSWGSDEVPRLRRPREHRSVLLIAPGGQESEIGASVRSASGESLFRVRVPLPRRVLTWQNGVEDRALVTLVRLHAHGLTTPEGPAL